MISFLDGIIIFAMIQIIKLNIDRHLHSTIMLPPAEGNYVGCLAPRQVLRYQEKGSQWLADNLGLVKAKFLLTVSVCQRSCSFCFLKWRRFGGDSGPGHTTLAPRWVQAEPADCLGMVLGTCWNESVRGCVWQGRNYFWDLPHTGPLHSQIGKRAETEQFRGGKPDGMYGSGQATHPCRRSGLG